MSPDIIREIAQAVVSTALIESWWFWLVFICATGLSAAITAYGASFLQKRAETAAMRRDMKDILRQLKETTEVATSTRTAIERIDWLDREWRVVRRQKLEQLLTAVYDLETWLEQMRERWTHGDAVTVDPRAIEKVKVLYTLYFPELTGVAANVLNAHARAYQFILQVGSPAGNAAADGDPERYESALVKFSSGWPVVYQEVRNAVATLEAEAGKLMKTITSAQPKNQNEQK
jgi:hypothetical protein